MTRLERKQQELEQLLATRRTAIRQGNLLWITKHDAKIKDLEREVRDMQQGQKVRLSEVLKDYGEDVKDEVYKCLLKISLAADFVNECSEQAKSVLRDINLKDFSLRSDVEDLVRISQKLASVVLIPNQELLTDMIVDNSEFIDTCDAAADKHLKEKLKL